MLKHREYYPTEWAAITAVSKRLGMTAGAVGSVNIRWTVVIATGDYRGGRGDPGPATP